MKALMKRIPSGRCHYCLHFTDGETEAWKLVELGFHAVTSKCQALGA